MDDEERFDFPDDAEADDHWTWGIYVPADSSDDDDD